MKRRDFMKNLGLGATTLGFGSLPVVLSACETNDSKGKEAQDDDQILYIGDDIAIADTQYGKVQGYILNKVYTFLGIPYGADTGGKNRFMPPQKPEPWTGILPAVFYAMPDFKNIRPEFKHLLGRSGSLASFKLLQVRNYYRFKPFNVNVFPVFNDIGGNLPRILI